MNDRIESEKKNHPTLLQRSTGERGKTGTGADLGYKAPRKTAPESICGLGHRTSGGKAPSGILKTSWTVYGVSSKKEPAKNKGLLCRTWVFVREEYASIR